MMDYPIQRYARDARITSIYEGTTQLQVVAAIRFVMNGAYLAHLRELEQQEVSAEMKEFQARARKMADAFEVAVERVKAAGVQEYQDLCARHLVEMAADTLMLHLLTYNATHAPELFSKSARVYARYAAAEVEKHLVFVNELSPEDLEAYRQV